MSRDLIESSDDDLVRRARAGSLAAFEEIVRRWQVPLLRFVLRRARCRADAEDIVQETLVRAWQKIGTYSSAHPLRTWLFTIAYRTWVTRGRRVAREIKTEAPDVGAIAAVDPVEQAETRSNLWDLARRELSDEQYAALWLFYAEDMPARQIAQVLGRSWVSVKTMLHRSRNKLEAAMREDRAAPARAEART